MLGSIQGCAQVAGGCSDCDAMSLPALTCTLVPIGHPTSTLPQRPPTNSLLHRSMMRRPKINLSPGVLVIWCKFENPLFLPKWVQNSLQRHTEHLRLPDFLCSLIIGT
eukprot:472238-Pelagomonas_calceolata.AAC.10